MLFKNAFTSQSKKYFSLCDITMPEGKWTQKAIMYLTKFFVFSFFSKGIVSVFSD